LLKDLTLTSFCHGFLLLLSSCCTQEIPIASLTISNSGIAEGPEHDIFLSSFSPSSPSFSSHSWNSSCLPYEQQLWDC
jgi:hypothetical protein